MNLRRLEYFVAVATELHFGRAADKLHMAQPPLSQQIRALEEELGLSLFDRSTRKVALTAAGKVLLEQANRLLSTADSVERVMDDFRSGTAGTLRLGFVDSAAYEVMPRFVREYRQRWPLVDFELRMLSSDQQARALRAGDIDIGIGRTMGDGDQIEAAILLREPLYVAVYSDHPLANVQSTQLRRLKNETVIGFDRTISPTFHSELVAMFLDAGFAYNPQIETTEYTSVLGLVAAGEGIAIVPAGVRSFNPPGLTYLKVRDRTAKVQLMLLNRRDDPLKLVGRAAELVAEVKHWTKP